MDFIMSAQRKLQQQNTLTTAARRFLVIDDHPFFLEGLKLGLASLDSLACQVDSHVCAQDALADVPRLGEYDLILCDLNLPGLDGIAFIERLIEADIFVRVAIISASQYALDVRRALNAGAAGYINKCVNIKEFAHAINLILKGQRYTPDKHSLLPFSGSQPSTEGQSLNGQPRMFQSRELNNDDSAQLSKRLEQAGISPRQYDVLKLVAKGLSNLAISQQLSIQESTVKSHLKVLFQILGVNNRTASIVAARSLNLLTDTE